MNHAVVWDPGLAVVSVVVPLVIFHEKMNPYTFVGMALVVSGALVTVFAEKLNS